MSNEALQLCHTKYQLLCSESTAVVAGMVLRKAVLAFEIPIPELLSDWLSSNCQDPPLNPSQKGFDRAPTP